MTTDEYLRNKRFINTELGAMWWKYHNAMINYWSANESEDTSPVELKKLDILLKEALEPFRARLMEIAGV
jgi:hypothetical protein